MTFLPALTGSFAHPAADNPTGPMVEAGYRHHGIFARYVNCDVRPGDLPDAVYGARAMGWLGFNCSLPHKVEVVDLVNDLTPAARIIGAVNCVKIDDGLLLGENTDGKGFVSSLLEVGPLEGREVVILGAGGAARAIAVESALAGAASLTIVNRDLGRATILAEKVARHTDCAPTAVEWSTTFEVPATTNILVNATSVGMLPRYEQMPNVDPASLRPDLIVADVVANPPTTRLLHTAAEAGCRTLSGLGMLVNQAVAGIRLWTGVDVDPAMLHATLAQALAGEAPPPPPPP